MSIAASKPRASGLRNAGGELTLLPLRLQGSRLAGIPDWRVDGISSRQYRDRGVPFAPKTILRGYRDHAPGCDACRMFFPSAKKTTISAMLVA
jgi:hypothetical protein